ncbi:hypothetical protein J3F84DRAFT_321873 [Trichoderma pleuroticola]
MELWPIAGCWNIFLVADLRRGRFPRAIDALRGSNSATALLFTRDVFLPQQSSAIYSVSRIPCSRYRHAARILLSNHNSPKKKKERIMLILDKTTRRTTASVLLERSWSSLSHQHQPHGF